jgi:hypothetical protein
VLRTERREEKKNELFSCNGIAGNFLFLKPLKAGSIGLLELHCGKQPKAAGFSHSPRPLVGLPAFG